MTMKSCTIAALLLLGVGWTTSALAADTPTHATAPGGQAAPKLTLFTPRPDILKTGYVYLEFQVDNLSMLPLYTEIHGEEALQLRPQIGHLHVRVDDSGWSWIHATPDPLYFGSLPPGPHKVRIELANAAHTVLDTQTVEFVMP